MKETKKQSSMIQKGKALLISSRPNTWLRIWGEMIVAAVLASYPHIDLVSFLKTFIGASPLIWSAAYMLNDLTDTKLDREHPFRKTRPIATREIGKNVALCTIIILTGSGILVGLTVQPMVALLLIVLVISQLLYTLPPIRLKERFFFDIAINTINSMVRFLLGWFSQIASHPFPVPVLLFFIFIKTILFIGHRAQNRNLEQENKIRSTVVVVPQTILNMLMLLFLLGSICSYVYALVVGIFPFVSLFSFVLLVPFALYIFHKRTLLLHQETNLQFRNMLYLAFFLWSNTVAVLILLQ